MSGRDAIAREAIGYRKERGGGRYCLVKALFAAKGISHLRVKRERRGFASFEGKNAWHEVGYKQP